MLHHDWLRAVPWRGFGRGSRTPVQVGLYRSPTHLIAARLRRDADCVDSVEQLEAVEVGNLQDGHALAHLLATGILRKAPVILVLGAEHYSTFPLPAPAVPPSELRDALRWKLRDLLPYAPEDAAIDCVRLAQAAGTQAAESLFAVAAPRRTVAQFADPLLDAGVDVQAVDIAEMAQRNLLTRLPGADGGRALLGLDDSSALLTVVEQGVLCFARRIQAPRSLGIEDDDPEHVAARIATHVQRSLEVFERQSGMAPVRTVWIGPHPYCALITRCTAEQTGLECLQLDLQAELRFAPTARELTPGIAGAALIAIGAGLRSEGTAGAVPAAPGRIRAVLAVRIEGGVTPDDGTPRSCNTTSTCSSASPPPGWPRRPCAARSCCAAAPSRWGRWLTPFRPATCAPPAVNWRARRRRPSGCGTRSTRGRARTPR
jgi:MSHA biogenesis protein MshI